MKIRLIKNVAIATIAAVNLLCTTAYAQTNDYGTGLRPGGRTKRH